VLQVDTFTAARYSAVLLGQVLSDEHACYAEHVILQPGKLHHHLAPPGKLLHVGLFAAGKQELAACAWQLLTDTCCMPLLRVIPARHKVNIA
jgi:hypothetical protein